MKNNKYLAQIILFVILNNKINNPFIWNFDKY